MASNR